MSLPPFPELLEVARTAADAAAAVHRHWASRIDPAAAVEKGQADFVSEADHESQAAALRVIRAAFPDHGILAEEEEEAGEGGRGADPALPLWIVDPLDGTTNFLHGHPLHAASVGVVWEGRPVAGAVTASALGEAWWGAEGCGAFCNGVPIRVSATTDLRRALIGTGFPFKRLAELPAFLSEFGRVLEGSSGIRRGGSAALDLCFLAQGSLDAFWEGFLSPWDVAGGLAILSEAGGTWRQMDGSPLTIETGGSVLAANGPGLWAQLAQRLRAEGPSGEL
jgi:myo-inositol-1(or 4)-monophosphatase